jgi:hypothetical protein
MSSKSKRRQQQKSTQKGTTPARQYVPAQKANPPVVKKQRGGWLTAVIVIMAIHGIFNTIALLSMRKAEYSQVPPWLWATAFLVGIATVVSAVALWYWKRWGLYLYLVATAGSIAVGLFVYPSQIAVFYNLIPVLILTYILQGQKKMALLA